MNDLKYRCRKCSEELFIHCYVMLLPECQITTQIFIKESKPPPWIAVVIEQGSFLKGKLNCPKCNGRIGAFDYVSHNLCGCGEHVLPPIRIHSDRVDKITVVPTVRGESLIASLKFLPRTIMSNNTGKNNEEDYRNTPSTSVMDSFSGGDHNTDNRILDQSVTNEEGGHSILNNRDSSSVSDNSLSDSTTPILSNRSTEPCSDDAQLPCEHGSNPPQDITDVNQFGVLDHEEVGENSQIEGISSIPEYTSPAIDLDPWTCSVCLELFYLPQMCEPCKHVFCDPCLRQLNANTVYGASVKCPLCRVVINSCSMHKEFNDTVKASFPEEHITRRNLEKRRKNLPSLPGKSLSLSNVLRRRRGQRNQSRNSDYRMVVAGLCFLMLITMLGFTIFAVTIGFVSWYLLEITIELVVDLTAELSTFFEILRCVIILLCIDGTVKEEYIQGLFNSSSRILMAFAKIIDSSERDHSKKESVATTVSFDGNILQSSDKIKVDSIHESMSSRTNELLTKVTQATIANYVVVGGLVTYLLYRLAKYLQTVRTGR